MRIPELDTPRLRIRELTSGDQFACLDAYQSVGWDFPAQHNTSQEEACSQWLTWTMLGYQMYAEQFQPPYGERAVDIKADNRMIGLVGLVPLLEPFSQLPSLGGHTKSKYTPGIGLFWLIHRAYHSNGYATEAASILIQHAFASLNLECIFAGTEFTNLASIRVMQQLGMVIEENPFTSPPWFQVRGILRHPNFGSFSY